MKKFSVVLFLFCLVSQVNAQNLHEDALTAASYAYSHSKKAYGANNVFHTQEYADKAYEAFQKVEDLADQCGCPEANETAYEAKTDMESSLTEDTYERSRFFAKRAKELGSKLLEQLTVCQEKAAKFGDVASNEEENQLAEASQEVLDKQQELEQKRRQLEIEQQKLEQQIAAQAQKQAEFEARQAAELKEKAIIKSKAEQALKKLQSALQELSIAINDDSNTSFDANYSRSENDLQNESIDDTKSFYVDRAKELTKSAMQQFAGYSSDN